MRTEERSGGSVWPHVFSGVVLVTLVATCGEASAPPSSSSSGGASSSGGWRACTTNEGCGGASASEVFCEPTVCGAPAGWCTKRRVSCPALTTIVCGCDGKTYINDCDARTAAAGVAYQGGCRSGSIVSCDADHPCPDQQLCIDDPRAACGSKMSCPGVCVTQFLSDQGCAFPSASGAGLEIVGCINGSTCVRIQSADCSTGDCYRCVYASRAVCDPTTPCPAGQLCVPTVCAAGEPTCPSVCAVP